MFCGLFLGSILEFLIHKNTWQNEIVSLSFAHKHRTSLVYLKSFIIHKNTWQNKIVPLSFAHKKKNFSKTEYQSMSDTELHCNRIPVHVGHRTLL